MANKGVLKNFYVLALALIVVAAALKLGLAYPTEPVGPNSITVINSSRLLNTSYRAKAIWAEAGNISAVAINATTATRSWQGYYGNVTGDIVLQDSSNHTLYNWKEVEPRGEIYAAINTTINWATIRCFNHTADGGMTWKIASTISATTEHSRMNMGNTDPDAINATFNASRHPAFSVGTVRINQSECYSTRTYVNSKAQTAVDITHEDFIEVLLTDGAPTAGGTNALVFTTFIENRNAYNDTDPIGFDGVKHDFQMLVLEDGHPGTGEDSPTQYYFWLELE